jgi:hypothetical protein
MDVRNGACEMPYIRINNHILNNKKKRKPLGLRFKNLL